MQAQVGVFRFEAAPGAAEFQSLARQRQRRWASRERYGRPARLEDLGRDADTLDLAGTLWITTADDLRAFDALKEQSGLPDVYDRSTELKPAAQSVFIGGGEQDSGQYIGQWVVTRLHERERDLRLDGVPTRVDFEISLKEYVP